MPDGVPEFPNNLIEEGGGTTGPSTGETWSAGISRGRIEDLQALEGVLVYDPVSGMQGIFRTRIDRGTGRRVYWLSDPQGSGQAYNLGTSPTVIDPRDLRLYTFAPSGEYQSKIASSSDLSRYGIDISSGGAGTSGTASYASTQASQAAQFAHDAEMARLSAELQAAQSQQDYARSRQLQLEIQRREQEFQAEQQKLSEEAALKRERLGVLQNLVTSFLESQQSATETLANLQPDPFKFASAAAGMPVFGTTPLSGYKSALENFIARPAPTVDVNASPEALQQSINAITGTQIPMAPGVFGSAAGGAHVPMGASASYLVGEEGPEIMEVSPMGVTVKPLMGGFATGGGVQFDKSTLMAALSPLYGALGFTQIPTFNVHPGPYSYVTPAGGSGLFGKSWLDALGYQPRIVRNRVTGEISYIEDGTLRPFESMKQIAGFGPDFWGQVVNLNPGTITELAPSRGPVMSAPPPVLATTPSPLGALPFPIIEPTTSAALAAPYRIAPSVRDLTAMNPTLANTALSAYGPANFPLGAVETAVNMLPRGITRSPLGLR